MEEILASIRRIIADDSSLPRGTPETAMEAPGPIERIEPTFETHAAQFAPLPVAPDPAPMRAHLLRGETVELDFRAMARQAGVARTAEVAQPPVAASHLELQSAPPAPETVARHGQEPASHPEPEAVAHHEPMAVFEDQAAPPPGTASLTSDMAHGTIAAPQYAGPSGPADHADGDAIVHEMEPATPTDMGWRRPIATQPVAMEAELYDEPLEGLRHDDIPEHPEPAHGTVGTHAVPAETLFSAATDASVTAAFRTLAATRLADNSEELLDIAREMIRPLLKIWIDDNVPGMVERMVRAEIERVARGGR